MSNKIVVFVHGSDHRQALTPWMFYHLHPSKYSRPLKSDGTVFDLVYFDYETGKRREWKNWTATRSQVEPSGVTLEGEILPKPEIRDGYGQPYSPPVKRPSAEAFYRWVKQQASGSIASIQIFSHATVLQPILFPDSFEWGDDLDKQFDVTADRDPRDSELRLRDFEGDNPLAPDRWGGGSGGELAKFKAALDPEVFIKVWGCGEMTYAQNDGDSIRKYLTDYLKVKSGKAGDAPRANLMAGYLFAIQTFWPYKLAEKLDLPVWAGPVGWGTDPFDVDGVYKPSTYKRDKYTWKGTFPPDLGKKEWWWRVSSKFRSEPKLAAIFTRDLKAKMDVLSYVEYRKSWVEAADRAAQAIVNPSSKGPITLPNPQDLMNGVREQMRLLGLGRSTPE